MQIHWMSVFLVVNLSVSPDSKVHGANMASAWVLSAPDGPMFAPWTLLSVSVSRWRLCIQKVNFVANYQKSYHILK